jgi:hypothetical protein
VSSGLVKPVRGFGKVWRDQPGGCAKLGAATGNERGAFAVPVQRLERGLMMGGAQGEVYVLFADNTWE